MELNKRMIKDVPQAYAIIKGSEKNKAIEGVVTFYAAGNGTIVVAEIDGLPEESSFFGFHIHNGDSCTGNSDDPFANAGTHLNLTDTQHPFHTGDLPVLLNNDGYVWSAVFTNRFKPYQVIDRAVVIHADPDDYRTQPAGNSGKKIACGIITTNQSL